MCAKALANKTTSQSMPRQLANVMIEKSNVILKSTIN